MAHDLDSYLGGLFDGEGCVRVGFYDGALNRRKSPHDQTTVSLAVVMTDRAPIDLLVSRFGGRNKVASRKTEAGRTVYRWDLTWTSTEEALNVLAEHCIIKRPQILLAQEAVRIIRLHKAFPIRYRGRPLLSAERSRRIEIAAEIRQLKAPPGAA